MTGWTQTPNFIYDLMPDMKEAEIKVVMVIVRETIGWQKESVSLSLSDFERLTGMARASVNSGIQAAIQRGILERTEDGQSFIYKIVEPPQETELVQILNHLDGTSTKSEPQLVQNLDHELVQNLDPIQRNIYTNKTKEREEEIAADAAPPSPPEPESPKKTPKRSRKSQTPPNTSAAPPPPESTEWQEFVGAMCWLCHGHKEVKALTREQRGALLSEAKLIYAEGYTTDDLREWYKQIWAQSWQYKKNKTSRPPPSDVRSSIAQLRAETPEGFEEPPIAVHVNGNSKVAASLAAIDEYEQLKLKHGVTT